MLVECDNPRCIWDSTKKLHEEIADLFHSTFRRSGKIEELSRESLTFFIRNDEGRVVSCAYGSPVSEDEIFVSFLTTAKKYRNRGYSSAILASLLSNSEPFNFNRITLKVDDADQLILNYYKNKNFHELTKEELEERNIPNVAGEACFSCTKFIMDWHGNEPNPTEWFNPMKVDKIRTIYVRRRRNEKKLRFHQVHFGWKDEGGKYILMNLHPKDRQKCWKTPLRAWNVEGVFVEVQHGYTSRMHPDQLPNSEMVSDIGTDVAENTEEDSETNHSSDSSCFESDIDELVKDNSDSGRERKRSTKDNSSVRRAKFSKNGGVGGRSKSSHYSEDDMRVKELSIARREWKLMEDLENLQCALDEFSEKINFYLRK